MRELRKKIQQREHDLLEKRNELHEYVGLIKNKVKHTARSPNTIRFTLLGSLFAGFILPRKLFRRKKIKDVAQTAELSPAKHDHLQENKTAPTTAPTHTRIHALLLHLLDVVAIVSAVASIKEAFSKVTGQLNKLPIKK